MLTRRAALSVAIRGLAAIEGASLLQLPTAQSAEEDHVVRTDAEWRKLLTPQQYAILRKEGTEPPFTSPLLHEERRGTFASWDANSTSSPPRPNSTAGQAGQA